VRVSVAAGAANTSVVRLKSFVSLIFQLDLSFQFCCSACSCEEDYVTEKFFHALAAGSVPVVVGAPNTGDFAPAPNSYLHIGSVEEIPRVAEKMR
jgi:hypothetical protein